MRTIHPESHPLRAAELHLRRNDAVIAALMDRCGQLCRLGEPRQSCFHTLVRTVIDQQLSVKAAARIAERLLLNVQQNEFRAADLSVLPDEVFRASGLSRNKTRCIRAVADAVVNEKLDFAQLEREDDAVVADTLMTFPGIGPWTADIFLMFALNRGDVLPLGDLALRAAMRAHYPLATSDSMIAYREVAKPWRPYRSLASWYLWTAVD